MILYRITFGFTEGKGREPVTSEVESLVCRTQAFFASELQRRLGDSQLTLKAIDIDWAYNGDFELRFAANVKDGNGDPVAENTVFQYLKLSDADLQKYMVDYVRKVSPPSGQLESVFANANQADFKSSQNVPIPVGRLPNGLSDICPQLLQQRGSSELMEGRREMNESQSGMSRSFDTSPASIGKLSCKSNIRKLVFMSAASNTNVVVSRRPLSQFSFVVIFGSKAMRASAPVKHKLRKTRMVRTLAYNIFIATSIEWLLCFDLTAILYLQHFIP